MAPGPGSKPQPTSTPPVIYVGGEPPTATRAPSTPTALVVNNALSNLPVVKGPQGQPQAAPSKRLTVRALLRMAAPSRLVRPGDLAHVGVTYGANVPVRVIVTAPGQPVIAVNAMTDKTGHLQLDYKVPATVRLRNGRATIHLTIQGVNVQPAAQVGQNLNVSDMVVTMSGSRITNCAQTQTVRVGYRPNTPLRVVLYFPHNRQATLLARSDARGDASVQVRLTYVKAVSPLRVVVHVYDARPQAPPKTRPQRTRSQAPPRTPVQAPRMERAEITVSLPLTCQQTVRSASLIVGG